MEEILGRPPDIQNLGDCMDTVRLLHTFGIVRGDLNKYNFLVTEMVQRFSILKLQLLKKTWVRQQLRRK